MTVTKTCEISYNEPELHMSHAMVEYTKQPTPQSLHRVRYRCSAFLNAMLSGQKGLAVTLKLVQELCCAV